MTFLNLDFNTAKIESFKKNIPIIRSHNKIISCKQKKINIMSEKLNPSASEATPPFKEVDLPAGEAGSRRNFVKKSALAFMAGSILPQFSAKSYANILGSNETINVSVMGVNSRGNALAQNFAAQNNANVIHVCDVDSRAITNCLTALKERQTLETKAYSDFRKSMESKDVDALVIAAKKYGKIVQMGNQRRSWPNVMAGIQAVKDGAIGRVYYGKGWYTNNRPSIGIGKETPVPEWLDWDLWQGPAPRKKFKDNIVHYDWHWRWHWGTGEALNNGTHMVDLLRWGMEVDYPTQVSSNGGRYRL